MKPAPTIPRRKGAAKTLKPLLRDVLACEDAVRAGDPDAGIHDMRVATKRLREALRLFEPAFRKKDHRRHLRWIEELNDTLGEVRDADVLRERLETRAAKLGRPAGFDDWIARLERRREGERSWVLYLLDRIRDRELAAKLEARLVRIAAAHDPADPPLETFAREAILERLEKVRRRWEKVRLDACPATFHRVRIANKQLRYAIEPFRKWLPPSVLAVYCTCSKFHDALGELHDEDVLVRRLETEMCTAKEGDRPGWQRLVRDTGRRRQRKLAKTLRLADALVGRGGFEELASALSHDAAVEPPDDDAPATPPEPPPTKH